MKRTKEYKTAKKYFPDSKISRPAGFLKKDNVVYISGYDEDVVIVISKKDLKTLHGLLPLDPVIDQCRVLENNRLKNSTS